jgi:hypothetical protein
MEKVGLKPRVDLSFWEHGPTGCLMVRAEKSGLTELFILEATRRDGKKEKAALSGGSIKNKWSQRKFMRVR